MKHFVTCLTFHDFREAKKEAKFTKDVRIKINDEKMDVIDEGNEKEVEVETNLVKAYEIIFENVNWLLVKK